MDVTGQRHRALLTGADLARWRASIEAPVTLDYAGLTVCKTGPWGQGPVFLQQLALLRGCGVDAMEPGSAEFIHIVVECAKLAFADREAWYGDPRFAAVPVAGLLSAEYADQRRQLISAEASGDLVPGAPGGLPPRLPGYATGDVQVPDGAGTGEPTVAPTGAGTGAPRPPAGAARPGAGLRRPGDTCHLDIAERRLAAELARHPRPRVLPGHPGADVHPHPGPAQYARTGQAAADHAVAEPGPARR